MAKMDVCLLENPMADNFDPKPTKLDTIIKSPASPVCEYVEGSEKQPKSTAERALYNAAQSFFDAPYQGGQNLFIGAIGALTEPHRVVAGAIAVKFNDYMQNQRLADALLQEPQPVKTEAANVVPLNKPKPGWKI